MTFYVRARAHTHTIVERKEIIPAWLIVEFATPSKDLAGSMHFIWLHYAEVSHKHTGDLAVQGASRDSFSSTSASGAFHVSVMQHILRIKFNQAEFLFILLDSEIPITWNPTS